MSLSESQIIEKLTQALALENWQGDDCAVVPQKADTQLHTSTDTYIAGKHFFENSQAKVVAQRVLGASLSDLAATGAKPVGWSLSLSAPKISERWLDELIAGFLPLTQSLVCPLLGGDTVCGPLALTCQVFGQTPHGQGLLRSTAKIGDELWVSGSLGAAAYGFLLHQASVNKKHCPVPFDEDAKNAFERPQPQVALGQALRSIASSMMDISDGIALDGARLAQASQVSLSIDLASLPVFSPLEAHFDEPAQYQQALGWGDDYQLLWTVPQHHSQTMAKISQSCSLSLGPISQIGHVIAQRLNEPIVWQGTALQVQCAKQALGYTHF